MAAHVEKLDRQIIPRWRRFRASVAMGELATSEVAPESRLYDSRAKRTLEEKLDDWRREGGLAFASDALGTALVLGRGTEARDAAEFILQLGDRATASARMLAETALSPRERWLVAEAKPLDTGELRREIAAQRRKLKDEPRNPIAWVDLAHGHTILGNLEHAHRAIRTALALAGDNRFVLRSAARFLLHAGHVSEAHKILTNTEATRTDPWLLAAEIAVACSAGRSPRFAKVGASVLAQQMNSPFQTTELASALATLELTTGNARAARKLFQNALQSPTENSVAQAEWASRQNIGLGVSRRALATPGSFEARAFEARAAGEWERALEEARRWFFDQPFSRHAASFSSYLASVPLERYDEAIEILRMGLVATPRDPLLLNNLAFALASSGRLAEAEERFAEIAPDTFAGPLEATLLATQGLLEYRRGRVERGRAGYLRAIEVAKRKGEPFQAALAALYFAREALLSRSPHALEAWAVALSHAADRKDAEIGSLRQRHEQQLSRGPSPGK